MDAPETGRTWTHLLGSTPGLPAGSEPGSGLPAQRGPPARAFLEEQGAFKWGGSATRPGTCAKTDARAHAESQRAGPRPWGDTATIRPEGSRCSHRPPRCGSGEPRPPTPDLGIAPASTASAPSLATRCVTLGRALPLCFGLPPG